MKNTTSEIAFSELNNKVQESVSGIKVTKSFGYQEAELQSFQETNKMTFKKNMHTMKYDSLFDPLVLLFVGSSYVLTLLVGAFMIQAGQITVGNLVTFITYLDMLVWPLMAIGFLFNITQRGNVSYQRIENLLEQESDVQDPAHPLPSIGNGRLEYAIDRFAFEDEDTLRDIHFTLDKGQTLGLVGQTGSGKTALVKLLLREHDVNQGAIYLNGHDIRDYRLSDLRSLMGYVPQDQFLFASSILDNVRFGNPDLSFDKVEEATKLAQVYDDIKDMPEGFETIIGEKGVSLSGGQKQRLAIARALLLKTEILLFDEARTSKNAKEELISLFPQTAHLASYLFVLLLNFHSSCICLISALFSYIKSNICFCASIKLFTRGISSAFCAAVIPSLIASYHPIFVIPFFKLLISIYAVSLVFSSIFYILSIVFLLLSLLLIFLYM